MHKICWNEAKTIGIIVKEDGYRLGLTYELRKGALNTLGVVSSEFMDAWGDMTAEDNCTVEEIDLAPAPESHLLVLIQLANAVLGEAPATATQFMGVQLSEIRAALAAAEPTASPQSREMEEPGEHAEVLAAIDACNSGEDE